jgi:anti-sigma regulatory factor (Ser/Thr protein kinase)
MNETRSFEHAPASAGAARRFAAEILAAGAEPAALEAIELMVSELATNCIRHTDSGFDLTIVRDPDRILVEATDRGAGEPRQRSPKPTEATGRGLQIVDMLSTDWGYHRSPNGGKTVWFTLDLSAGSPADDVDIRERGDRVPERQTGAGVLTRS